MSDWWPPLILAPFFAFLIFAMQEWGSLYRIRDHQLVIYTLLLPDREIDLDHITHIEVTRRKKMRPWGGSLFNVYVSRTFARHVLVKLRDGRKFLLAPKDAETFARDLAFSSGAEAVWTN